MAITSANNLKMAITSAILAITSVKQSKHQWDTSGATVTNVVIPSTTIMVKPSTNKAKTSA